MCNLETYTILVEFYNHHDCICMYVVFKIQKMVQNLTCAIIRNQIALTTTLNQFTIIGTQINTRLLFHFQTFFYLEYHFGPQIIMHFRVCSLVISLDYSKLTNSLHKGLIMCVFFSLVQACWHGFGKAVRLVRQRLFIIM